MAPLFHPGTRKAMPDDRRRSAGTWDIVGYHGTTWASMQQPRRHAPAASPVGNCSLTVPRLKESLTLRRAPGEQFQKHDPNPPEGMAERCPGTASGSPKLCLKG